MEISISEEQDHLLKMAEKNAMPGLLKTGNLLPTIFVHTGEEINFFQFQPCSDLDSLRQTAIKIVQERCSQVLAYVLVYDSTININDASIDALILETGDEEDSISIEFGVPYYRDQARSEEIRPLAKIDNPIFKE